MSVHGQKIRRFNLPFPREEFEKRHIRVRREMGRKNVAAAISTEPRDFYWLNGTRVDFWAAQSPQWAIITEDDLLGIVRKLEASTHGISSYIQDWIIYPDEGKVNPYDPLLYTVGELKRRKLERSRVGINMHTWSAEEFARIRELLPHAEFVDFRIENIRVKRSPLELDYFRLASDANQYALASLIERVKPGWSEWGILRQIARFHSQYLGTDYLHSVMGATCCQVGARHMQHMHARRNPQERKLQRVSKRGGIWLEPGVFVKRYPGTMLRTVWFGRPPRSVEYAVNSCIEALDMLIDAIGPGKTAHEVDAVPRSYLTARKLDIQHRSGYTSSEDWLDGGILSLTPQNPLVLEPGYVFHCPIHVHVPGYGYVGVSEQIVVTKNGREVLGDHERTCERKLHIK